ncbi:LysM domain-containing protein [Melghirimyces profundicolus]|uniref:LysM domain-containing protein n=1 Tax=Melghirimyces profundicolus TaxID=1242148 RepID=A0A2T6BS86_9BACL|nr:LysM peptidoglycan-binding domain-containing C40 family peptidase [Melghirimyces profundicolus]PTX58909.1 LysM domain-containing protein [Melghirimyces profundicolus]
MVYHPDRKVMTSLTLAGSLLFGSHSANAAAVKPEVQKENANDRMKGNEVVEKASVVQKSPHKMQYNVISSGIRMHMGANSGSTPSGEVQAEGRLKVSAGYHVVEKGDTLSEIAQEHNTQLNALLKLNTQVKDPDRIYVGQKIRLGASAESEGTLSSDKSSVEGSGEKEGTVKLASKGGGEASGGWQAKAAAIINDAKAKLNASYRYGATGPSSFDCSGFTQYVFSQNGYNLPRSSSAQATVGVSVTRGDLRAGDLLFFRTGGGGISHVSIYMGDGQIIHATNPEQDITINHLSEAYWSERFSGARRVIH